MRIVDFGGSSQVQGVEEVCQLLKRRFLSGINSYILSPDNSEFPQLIISVKAGVAAIFYIPSDGHAGYRPISHKSGGDVDGITTFPMSESPADDISVSNDTVVTESLAIEVAEKFLESCTIPSTVRWEQL